MIAAYTETQDVEKQCSSHCQVDGMYGECTYNFIYGAPPTPE